MVGCALSGYAGSLKTNRAFSSIALDHDLEQVNALVKGQGGAVGLTENPAAVIRWMVAGHKLSRMVEEFEGSFTVSEERDHHEQKQVCNLHF